MAKYLNLFMLHLLVHDTPLPVDNSFQAQVRQAIESICQPECRGLRPPDVVNQVIPTVELHTADSVSHARLNSGESVDDGNDHEATPNVRGLDMWGPSSALYTPIWDGDSSDESEPPDPPDAIKGADPLQAARRGTGPMTSERANDSNRSQVKYVELDNGTPSLDAASVAARDEQQYGWNAMRWRETQRRVMQDQARVQWDISQHMAEVTSDLECIHISAKTEYDQVAGSALHKEQVHALIRGMDPGVGLTVDPVVGLTDEVKETKTRQSPDGDHESRCQ